MDILRLYQQQVLDQCSRESTIAILPTGSGKTLIACYLIKYRVAQKMRKETAFKENSVVIFIAPTKVLLAQQIKYLTESTADSVVAVKIAEVNGESKFNGKIVDRWTQEEWKTYLDKNDVIGMTPELLRRLLEQSILAIQLIDCVIFDECHHVLGQDGAMGKACDAIYERCDLNGKRPLILGMTASPTHSKRGTYEKNIRKLEERMGAKVFVPNSKTIQCLNVHVNRPTFYVAYFGDNSYFEDYAMQSSLLRLQHAVYVRYFYSYHYTLYPSMSVRDNPTLAALGLPADSQRYILNSFLMNGAKDKDMITSASVSLSILSYVQETLAQCERVARECGSYCAFIAFLTLLSEYKDLANSLDIPFIKRLSKIDDSRFSDLIHEVFLGPFSEKIEDSDVPLVSSEENERSRLPEIFSPHLALILSLTEFFLSLYLSLPLSISIAVVNKIGSSNSEHPIFAPLLKWLQIHRKKSRSNVFPSMGYRYGGVLVLFFDQKDYFTIEGRKLWNITKFIDSLESICKLIKPIMPLQDLLQYTALPPSVEADCMKYERQLQLQPFESIDNHSIDSLEVERAVSSHDSLFSPKLISLLQTWKYFWCKNGQNQMMTSIIFCEMTLTVRTINKLLNEMDAAGTNVGDRSEDAMQTPTKRSSIERISMKSSALYGENSQTEQSEVLKSIKSDVCNILVATTIAEEGLDIKSCQLVINFNHPPTAKSFIQRMGRARAESAAMISLVGLADDKQCDKMIKDLRGFTTEAKRFDDETGRMWNELRKSADEDKSDDEFSAERDGCYVVRSTGAVADFISAKAIVHQYCTGLSTDSYYTAVPIFSVRRKDDNSFLCSLLLPQNVPDQARCIVSPPRGNKKAAIGSAAVGAVEKLHKAGELTDNLTVIRTEVNKLQLTKKSEGEKVVQVKIKTQPDMFSNSDNNSCCSSALITLYLYVLDDDTCESKHLELLAGCHDSKIGFEIISSTAIALRTMATCLSDPFILNFGTTAWKEYRFKYFGKVDLNHSEYEKVVLLHRSTYLRELMLSSFEGKIIVIHNEDDLNNKRNQLREDCLKKIQSLSEDSTILVVPLPLLSGSNVIDKGVLASSVAFADYAERSAFESQILMHNIDTVRKTQSKKAGKANILIRI